MKGLGPRVDGVIVFGGVARVVAGGKAPGRGLEAQRGAKLLRDGHAVGRQKRDIGCETAELAFDGGAGKRSVDVDERGVPAHHVAGLDCERHAGHRAVGLASVAKKRVRRVGQAEVVLVGLDERRHRGRRVRVRRRHCRGIGAVAARHEHEAPIVRGRAADEVDRALHRVVEVGRQAGVAVDVRPRLGKLLLVLGAAQRRTPVEARDVLAWRTLSSSAAVCVAVAVVAVAVAVESES